MRIVPSKDALLVVDLQADFLPGGALAVATADQIVTPIARLVHRFPTVVATQDFHPRGHVSFASSHPGHAPLDRLLLPGGEQVLWPDHCVAGTTGAALHPALPDEAIGLILRKGTRPDIDSYSAFRENPGPDGTRASTGLGAWLRARGIERVFLCGLTRDYCVRHSALDAAREGFATVVIDDLTRAVFPERSAEVDAALAEAGVRRIAAAELAGPPPKDGGAEGPVSDMAKP
jgi:nicotinamidase/pyrazinamidase